MTGTYQKICYDAHPAFQLHHTCGHEAGKSTLGYLHRNNAQMLICFLQGSGSIAVEGHHYPICQGDAILLKPSEVFLCRVDDNCYHERIVLYVKDDFLKGTPYSGQDLLKPFWDRKNGVGNRISAEAFQKFGLDVLLYKLLELSPNTESSGQALSYAKLIEFLTVLRQAIPTDASHISEKIEENSRIFHILEYLDTHFREPICIDGIADHFGMNKSYLSHIFKECVGISLWNYVIHRRLNAFNTLIRRGHSVEQACWQVGFQNYSNFFRLYKKHMGITPMQFKKQLDQ